MSASYTSILWNKNKKRYDIAILVGIVAFIATFTLLNLTLNPEVTFETNLIRSVCQRCDHSNVPPTLLLPPLGLPSSNCDIF